jgi:cyclopropane fatty-acyl-phospholipid synthase-like methyltransferase
MNDAWKRIWELKGSAVPRDLVEAISVNGFDTGGGKLELADFHRLVERIRQALDVTPASRVLDVGCGCGVILQGLSAGIAVGVDYSSSMIHTARQLCPQATFQHAEASDFEVEQGAFDAVLSHNLFMYLKDLEEVRRMLWRMTRSLRPGGRGLLLDIPDAATRDECEAYRATTISDYRQRYADTQHSYWRKEDLLEALRTLRCRAWLIEHFTCNYENRRFRFNVQFEKMNADVQAA